LPADVISSKFFNPLGDQYQSLKRQISGGASVASCRDLVDVVVWYAVVSGEPICRAVADRGGNLPAATVERVLLTA
jgi:hypothetical protein